MALLWHSFVEAMALGNDQPGQGGSGHHNCTVGGHPLSHEPADAHVRGHTPGQALITKGYWVTPM